MTLVDDPTTATEGANRYSSDTVAAPSTAPENETKRISESIPQAGPTADVEKHAAQHAESSGSEADAEAGDDKESDPNAPIIVGWEGEDDPENPKNWSRTYRWYATIWSGILVLNSTFTSSAPSGAVPGMMQHFGFGREVATLTISMFICGYILGPLIWGPMSERVGRYPTFMLALTGYAGFNLGCALAPNTGAILVFRFLAGTFASSPLTNSGGLIADVWDADTRGTAMSLFSLAPFAGPTLGPLVSGAIAVRGVYFRWTYWVCFFFSCFCWVVTLLTIKETYAPIILARKAKRLRKETGNERLAASIELVKLQPGDFIKTTLFKPFKMLLEEPMLLAITIYISFVYGVLYLLFEAVPIVFEAPKPVGHGFNPLIGGLMFLPLFTGSAVGVAAYVLLENPRYVRLMRKSPNGRVAPEERLVVGIIGGATFFISFFWFGWTSFPKVSFWAPLMALGLLGFSILLLFLSMLSYIVEAYLFAAASGLAANTAVRSAMGAAMPLFATQMFLGMNPRWASTLLGFVALAMAPIPIVLYRFGPKLRSMSKHAMG